MEEFKIMCVMTYLRGGSKLFHSLLDWHPQVIGFPRTIQFNKFWKNVEHRKNDLEYIVDSFITNYRRFFSGEEWHQHNRYDRADRLGPDMNETFSVDSELFRTNALSRLRNQDITRANVFVALHLAYHEACGRELSSNSIILYHIHDIIEEDTLAQCLSDFPHKTHLIVVTRHPIQGINSGVKWMKLHNNVACQGVFYFHMRQLYGTSRLTERFPGLNIEVVLFEQLHLQHREVMGALVDWMGIEWDESLMQSTMHGKLWWSNGKIALNGTNPEWKIYQPSGFLEMKDWIVHHDLVPRRMERFGFVAEIDKRNVPSRMCLLLLPSAPEWSVLSLFFSIKHWMQVYAEISKEVSNETTGGGGIDGKMAVFSIKFRRLLLHIKNLSPAAWAYYYMKRVINSYRFLKRTNRVPEILPSRLLDKTFLTG